MREGGAIYHPLAPALDLRYPTPRGQDPATRSETCRNSTPLADHRSDGSSPNRSDSRQLPSQASSLFAWAQENGWLIEGTKSTRFGL
jgi:hypothetical protein